MKRYENDRGFRGISHPAYVIGPEVEKRVIQESSAVGDYEDSLECPGSSYLWVGEDHHLNREEVRHLVADLDYWLENKRLPKEAP